MKKLTLVDYENIRKICDRASKMNPVFANDRIGLMMDLEYGHNDIELDFAKLAEFADFDFAHDVIGIHNHFNRRTFKFDDCFVPRCAKPDKGSKE